MFHTRKLFHRTIYKHKAVSAIELMFVDMISKAEFKDNPFNMDDQELNASLNADDTDDLKKRKIYKCLYSIRLVGASSRFRQNNIKTLIKVTKI
jgi:hypothetical protein